MTVQDYSDSILPGAGRTSEGAFIEAKNQAFFKNSDFSMKLMPSILQSMS